MQVYLPLQKKKANLSMNTGSSVDKKKDKPPDTRHKSANKTGSWNENKFCKIEIYLHGQSLEYWCRGNLPVGSLSSETSIFHEVNGPETEVWLTAVAVITLERQIEIDSSTMSAWAALWDQRKPME